MRLFRKKELFFILIIIVLAVGCSPKKFNSVDDLEGKKVTREFPATAKVLEVEISSGDFTHTVSQDSSINGLRMVERVLPNLPPHLTLPEYRLFDINPRSIYHKVGLRVADVLISVDNLVVWNPGAFRQIVANLDKIGGMRVQIIRSGVPVELKVRVTS